MGFDLIIAMALAGMVVRSYEQSKRRATAAWTQARQRARQRADERDQQRRERAGQRRQRIDAASRKGPRDPLWWPYAVSWLAAASLRASLAAAKGAAEGAPFGAREGYRIGREGARKASGYRRTWRQWRRHRHARPVGVQLLPCHACGLYTAVDGLTEGRCRDCAGPTAGTTPQPDETPGQAPPEEADNEPREKTGSKARPEDNEPAQEAPAEERTCLRCETQPATSYDVICQDCKDLENAEIENEEADLLRAGQCAYTEPADPSGRYLEYCREETAPRSPYCQGHTPGPSRTIPGSPLVSAAQSSTPSETTSARHQEERNR